MVNPFVKDFIKRSVLKTPEIIEAFEKINRADFVLPEDRDNAYIDAPLPIGKGQTISQPYTVAFMLELLQPEPGNKIFEIGFGSGWQTALLAEIVGAKGRIFAVERIPELYRFGRKNIAKYSFIKKSVVKTISGDATSGLRRHAPFDGIIAAASGKEVPVAWLKELKVGGRLIMPIQNSIWLYIKKSNKEFEKYEYPGFVFVPLVSEKYTRLDTPFGT